MPNISLLLICKNEEENLKKWPSWVKKLDRVDEIVAIDDGSTDNTKKILKTLGAKIWSRGLDDDFSAQRNFAISKAKNDWCLFFDADEEPSESLIDFLNSEPLDPGFSYAFKRHLVYLNHIVKHGPSHSDYPIRLFLKTKGRFVGSVHEVFAPTNCPLKIRYPVLHFSAPSLKIFLEKINRYSTLRAQELFDKQVKVNTLKVILYTKGKFLQTYFWQLGFLDGIPGIIICTSLSFYSFLVRSKLWRLYHP